MPDSTNDGQLQWVVRYDHHHCHILCRELICSTCTSPKVKFFYMYNVLGGCLFEAG